MSTFSNDWLLHDPGARDFAAAYLAHRETSQEATIAGMARIPGFVRVAASRTRAESEAGYAAYWHGVERAFAGDWEARAATLRFSGITFAHAGATIEDWQDLAELACDLVRDELFRRHGTEPERLRAAMRVMQQFIDRSFFVFTTAYVTAAREQLRQIDALQTRALELESENRQVRAASRAKSEFLASMSHELRTPLNAILGFSELLKDGEVGALAAQQLEFIEDIHTSGQHLLRLINDILDLSKVEAGRLEFHPEDIDLGEATREIVQSLRGIAAQRRIDIELDEAARHVRIDPVRYKQVLYNYLSNALNHGGTTGDLTVRIRLDGEHTFRLEVSDRGLGIPREQLSRLFQVFEQLDGSGTRHQGGTGLGLALTRRLVEAQGGVVGVTSEVGQGSTFHAIFPRHARSTASLPAPRQIAGAKPEALRVLVLDAGHADHDRTVASLLAAGYAVDTVSSSTQASRNAETHHYAGLLLTSTNPSEQLARLRELPGLGELPVVELPSPIDPSQLTAALNELLRV